MQCRRLIQRVGRPWFVMPWHHGWMTQTAVDSWEQSFFESPPCTVAGGRLFQWQCMKINSSISEQNSRKSALLWKITTGKMSCDFSCYKMKPISTKLFLRLCSLVRQHVPGIFSPKQPKQLQKVQFSGRWVRLLSQFWSNMANTIFCRSNLLKQLAKAGDNTSSRRFASFSVL